MTIDTSAIIAILRHEPEQRLFLEAITAAPARRMSAASYVELAAVIDGQRDPVASRRVDDFLTAAAIRIEPFTAEQARIARDAYRDFGKGSGHKARLNLGDCYAYALAKTRSEQLLYKGNDFSHTDIDSAA